MTRSAISQASEHPTVHNNIDIQSLAGPCFRSFLNLLNTVIPDTAMSRYNLYEFFIPENIASASDASDYPGATTFFEETVDVTVMSGTEQADTLSSIFRELGASASRISEQFSRLFSFAKRLGEEGVIHKDARAVMGEKLPTLLREVNKISGRFLTSAAAKNATPEAYEDACLALRSSTKMYAFLICHLLRSRCIVVQEAGASQPSALARRAAAKRGRTARAGVGSAIPADEDESGLNSITREMCITSLNEVLASDLCPIWRRTAEAVEMPLCQLMLRTALHMVGQKNNIDGIDASAGSSDTNPVAMALVHWSSNLTSRFGKQYCLDRGTSSSSLDVVISPLVERLLRSAHPLHCSRFITRQIAMIDESSRTVGPEASFSEKHWSYIFLASLFSGIAHAALTDVVGDGPAAKAVAQLLEELAQHRISVIAIFFDSFIEPLLNSESYEVRKAALTCQAEMIVQTLVGNPSSVPMVGLESLDVEVVEMIRPLANEFNPAPPSGPPISALDEPDALLDGDDASRGAGDGAVLTPPPRTVEQVKNKYLRSLWARLRDLNPFARLHCVKLWIDLVERRSVPKGFYLPLVIEASGRLSDRNYLVRRASLMLLQSCLGRAWFGLVLQRTLLAKTRDEHILSASRKYLEDAQRGDAPNETPEVPFEEFLEANRQLARAADERALSGSDVHAAALPSPLTTAIITCDRAIEFSSVISDALAKAAELLDSKTLADVTQSINFIVSCVHNRVDNSIQTALRMLSLIFSEELTVKAAVSKAFVDIFFNLPQLSNIASVPLKTVNLARAHKMIGVIAVANEGDLYAMEEILETNRREQGTVLVNEKLLDAVMSILAEGVDDGTADPMMRLNRERERRVTMQLYALLVSTLPRDIQTRKPDLMDLIDRYSNDNVFLAHVWDALSKEVRVPGFAPIDEGRLPIPKDPNSHPLLQRALHHLCRPTANLGTWVVMAGSIINYVHSCYSVPSKIYTMVSSYLTASIIGSYTLSAFGPQEDGDSATPSLPAMAKIITSPHADQNRVGQLFFITGQSAIKHLVTIDNNEREQMRLIDDRARAAPLALPNAAETASPRGTARPSTRGASQIAPAAPAADVDVMHKELGLASTAHQRYELQEAYQKAKNDMLANPSSLWAINSKLIATYLMAKGAEELTVGNPVVRISACTALTRLCIASEEFCAKHLRLLFTILSSKKEHWAVKTNTIIAMGDMLCVFPNTLEPYLELETTGFYALLSDPDVRVRSITVQVCTFLILNDMLKVRDHLHTIMRLVADTDPTIAGNATQFIHHLAIKQKRNIGNLIPPLVPQLSCQMSQEHFQFAMRVLLDKVEGDKAIEGVVDKLCSRFSRYVDERTKTQKANEQRLLARNLAFCIVEMDCSSERIMKRLMSESVYGKYKQWLRDSEVLASFQSLATKLLRRVGGGPNGGTERRDRLAIEEWSQRLLVDASVLSPVAPLGPSRGGDGVEEDDDSHSSSDSDAEVGGRGGARGSSDLRNSGKRGRATKREDNNEEEDELLLGRHAAASTALLTQSQSVGDDGTPEEDRKSVV